jgi:hypothetical protein
MHSKIRATALATSCRLFGLLLPLYPPGLRRRFGPDMAEVFEQQIRDEGHRRGFAGVARVWMGLASDVVRSSLPDEIHWQGVLVPVLSLVGSFVLFALFFAASHLADRCLK